MQWDAHLPKKFHFCLVSPQTVFPKVLGIIKIMLYGKHKTAVFFLVSSGFRLSILPRMPFLPSPPSYCWITHARPAVLSMLFRLLLWPPVWLVITLGVILVGRPLLGRFTTVPCFLHLWIMAVTVVPWSPKALDNGFVTVFRLTDINVVSHLFLNLFGSGHDVLLFEIF